MLECSSQRDGEMLELVAIEQRLHLGKDSVDDCVHCCSFPYTDGNSFVGRSADVLVNGYLSDYQPRYE